jgi:hypothetical protein
MAHYPEGCAPARCFLRKLWRGRRNFFGRIMTAYPLDLQGAKAAFAVPVDQRTAVICDSRLWSCPSIS